MIQQSTEIASTQNVSVEATGPQGSVSIGESTSVTKKQEFLDNCGCDDIVDCEFAEDQEGIAA